MTKDEIDKAVESLVKSYRRPNISDVQPLAKAKNISSIYDFWFFFDSIQHRWAQNRNTEAGYV